MDREVTYDIIQIFGVGVRGFIQSSQERLHNKVDYVRNAPYVAVRCIWDTIVLLYEGSSGVYNNIVDRCIICCKADKVEIFGGTSVYDAILGNMTHLIKPPTLASTIEECDTT